MAMAILHNSSAQLTLGELNKNINQAGKLLSRLSSGQKITSAKDNASAYAISEKMRERIRTLLQDNQNVQNGSSLLRTAEGGVSNIVDELRSLKELAIAAATDTNTDEDRRVLQKNFEQKMANINDIATTTDYNGKRLLDGTYGAKTVTKFVDVPIIDEAGDSTIPDVTPKNLTAGFSPYSSDTFVVSPTPQYSNYNGEYEPYYPINSAYWTDINSPNPVPMRINVDFSSLILSGDVPETLNNKGFCILCGGCSQFINIVFDGTSDDSTYNPNFSTVNVGARQYTIGIKSVRSLEDLPKAIFEGIKSTYRTVDEYYEYVLPDTENSISVDPNHDVRIEKIDDTYVFYKNAMSPAFEFYGEGIINEDGELVDNPEKHVANMKREAVETLEYNPLIIHSGTQSWQSISVVINDMHTKSLKGQIPNEADAEHLNTLSNDEDKFNAYQAILDKAKDMTLDDASLATRADANVAIRVIEGAIDYALDEATTLGAYLNRLEYTASNITIMGENVQAAESAIRDADMAKEMTNYTKANVLTQAAQSMLAQANQNSSAVLSLIQ